MSDFSPIHPGEILLEEFMGPLGLSRNKLATALLVPAQRIEGPKKYHRRYRHAIN